jgi:hypothetical protein
MKKRVTLTDESDLKVTKEETSLINVIPNMFSNVYLSHI